MPDGVALLTAKGEGARRLLALPAESIRLTMPLGRRLDRASLSLRAADNSRTVLDGLVVTTDTGAFPLPDNAPARWIAASWREDRAVVGVHIETANNDQKKIGARLKVLSAGNWLPLTPVDVIALNAEQFFPVVAATQVMAELLVENTIDGKPTGVLVPGEVAVEKMSVIRTEQPCHVTVATGDDLPFFTHPGPLPVEPVQVDGLTRAANRYLVDYPGATEVPLRIRAAGPAEASLVIESFEASLQPEQPASSPQPEARAPDSDEADARPGPGEQTWGGTAAGTTAPATAIGQWCSPTHVVTQAFAPLPLGKALSSLRVHLRATQVPSCTGTIAIHPDAHGRPADTPLADAAAGFTVGTASADASPAWIVCRLSKPLPLSDALWWAVCRVASGESVWIATAKAPAEAGQTLRQVEGGPWLPAPVTGEKGWVQTEVRIVNRPPTRI